MTQTMELFKPYEAEMLVTSSSKNEMYLSASRKVLRTVKVVLISVMKSLPASQGNEIIRKLPSALQMIFAGNWMAEMQHEPVMHLDEIVERVCENDSAKNETIFTDEVDALRSVLVAIKYLKTVFDKIGIHVLPYSLINEYQQAMQEESN